MMQKLLEVELPRLMSLRISTQSYMEMEAALYDYLDYHLDYSAKTRRFLQQLLNEEKTSG